jgi:hypothetical protein
MGELRYSWYLVGVCGLFHNPAVLIPGNGRLVRPIWTNIYEQCLKSLLLLLFLFMLLLHVSSVTVNINLHSGSNKFFAHAVVVWWATICP